MIGAESTIVVSLTKVGAHGGVLCNEPKTSACSVFHREFGFSLDAGIRAEHKLHSISKLFISQVIIPQVFFFFFFFFLAAYLYSAGTQHGNLPLEG